MWELRSYQLEEVADRVRRVAQFRGPQRASFDAFVELMLYLDDDLPELAQDRLIEQLIDRGLEVPVAPPDLVFALATGVGKTRLLGMLIAFLHLSRQTNNCLILAPRLAIIEKFERESQSFSQKYLFVDPGLVPEPNLCFRSNLEGFEPDPERLNLFILTPQTITGTEKRFHRISEFREHSLANYLRDCPDLVVFADEAHHFPGTSRDEAAAWREAVRALDPRLTLGFTATPVVEEGSNILYSYDLSKCLEEGQHTKAVNVWTESQPADLREEEWDHVTLDFALDRLRAKEAAVEQLSATRLNFPAIQPVLLVATRDKAHAEQIGSWLVEERSLDAEEVYVTHSSKAQGEEEIRRLLEIDEPGNPIRVVVNVFQLTEGWDVTSVYVVAPLRAMATFQSAVQIMGRGLRLPAGARADDPEGDTLDVLCFGRETFEQIVEQATSEFGVGSGSPSIEVRPGREVPVGVVATKRVTLEMQKPVAVPLPTVERIPAEPDLSLHLSGADGLGTRLVRLDLGSLERSGSDEGDLRFALEDVIRLSTQRILATLPYLSPVTHGAELNKRIADWLRSLGAEDGGFVALDPVKVAAALATHIDRRYRAIPAAYRVTDHGDELHVRDAKVLVPEDYEDAVERPTVSAWAEQIL